MNDDTARKIAEALSALIQDTLASAGYKISDLVNSYPDKARFIVVAAMQMAVDSLKLRFAPPEKAMFEQILKHTETIVMPGEFDPKRKG